jgi:hypothetical protein
MPMIRLPRTAGQPTERAPGMIVRLSLQKKAEDVSVLNQNLRSPITDPESAVTAIG